MMIKRSSCVICIMAIIFRRSSSSANIFVVVRSLLVTMLCYASSISRISLEHRTHLNRIKRRKQVICLLSGIVHCSTLTDRFDFIHLNLGEWITINKLKILDCDFVCIFTKTVFTKTTKRVLEGSYCRVNLNLRRWMR